MPASAGRAARRGSPGAPSRPATMSPIVEHPDVARIAPDDEGADRRRPRHRLCLRPRDRHGEGAPGTTADEAKAWKERANLLTPIAKAFSTDIGVEVASLGIQVHGGMGYIEETGAARLLRDARIAPIYEGTNGIQAIDLVTRKIGQSGGDAVAAYLAELDETIEAVRGRNAPEFGEAGEALAAAMADLREATRFLHEALTAGGHRHGPCGGDGLSAGSSA